MLALLESFLGVISVLPLAPDVSIALWAQERASSHHLQDQPPENVLETNAGDSDKKEVLPGPS